jgi:hypothetical protein
MVQVDIQRIIVTKVLEVGKIQEKKQQQQQQQQQH